MSDPAMVSTNSANLVSLVNLITRRPYRRSAIVAETALDIQKKVTRYGVRFSVPFGGYKGLGLPDSPSLNWAEVAWLDYLRAYAEPMTRWVDTEIEFAFTYLSGVLSFINHTSDAEQVHYLDQLTQLADAMSGDGVRFKLVDLTERAGGRKQVLSQIETNYANLRSTRREVSPEKIASAARNWRSPQTSGNSQSATALSHLSDSNRDDNARLAALRCEAMEMLPARRQFNKYGEHIQLTHVRGASQAVHIGSCRSSVVQPWVGQAVFEQKSKNTPTIHGLTRSVVLDAAPAPAPGVIAYEWVPRILGSNGLSQLTRLSRGSGQSGVEVRSVDLKEGEMASCLDLSVRALSAARLFPHLDKVLVVTSEPEVR
ncbi:hypothetical protein [Orrella marina]|uniref:Uncharacterized protein n=1 Tax=Orrella marina TaxID=2163011 RepID=A0A2R4XH31_9BURK|nr:hypothetical protein [Orrella marina]AWB33019.1 hypothetical protein DBV39_04005 [Orrella marina]